MLGDRQLKENWAAVKEQIGFLYAAHFVQMENGQTLAQYIAKVGISKPIKHDTLVTLLGSAQAFHDTVLSRMTNASDWHIEFPTSVPQMEFPGSPALTEQHQAIVRKHFRNNE